MNEIGFFLFRSCSTREY